MFTSHLAKLTLTAALGRELAAGQGSVGVKHAECWGCPWPKWRDPQGRHFQWFMDELLVGVHDAVSRVRILFIPSEF